MEAVVSDFNASAPLPIVDPSDDGMMIEEGLAPYTYQKITYELAIQRNIISVLPTGKGKTLISVLLLKYMNSEVLGAIPRGKPRKSIFFLCTTVHLAHQQHEYIKRNSHLRPRLIHGSNGVDEWDYCRWERELSQHIVFVTTPDTLKNALSRGYIKMEKLALIVIDECHNSMRGSPYNYIMSNFYHNCPMKDRPKIFGMTASPYYGKGEIPFRVRVIEENLDSIVFCPALEELRNKLDTVPLYYSTDDAYEVSIDELKNKIAELKGGTLGYLHNTVLSNFKYVYDTLGPWCAQISLALTLLDEVQCVSNTKMVTSGECAEGSGSDSGAGTAYDIGRAKMIYNINRKLQFLNSLSERLGDDWLKVIDVPTDKDLSQKVLKLIAFLRSMCNEHIRCIIFVERRITALALCLLFNNFYPVNSCKFGYVTGRWNGKIYTGIGKAISSQHGVDDLRNRKINVLFSTRVCEEGIDINDCSIIVRFDPPATYISHIQSRGRLRSDVGQYVVMIPNFAAASELCTLEEYEETENILNDIVTDSKRRILSLIPDTMSKLYYPHSRTIRFPSTGALVTPNNAVQILNKYCTSHARFSDCAKQKSSGFRYEIVPERGGTFACIMSPPRYLNLDVEMFFVGGESSGKNAKDACAVKVVRYLISEGKINDRLRPGDLPERKPQRIIQKSQIDVKVNLNLSLPTDISFPVGGGKVHITLLLKREGLSGGKIMKLGILTPNKLRICNPKFTLNFADKILDGEFICVQETLTLSELQLDAIRLFHYTLFRRILRSKISPKGNFTLLVFPVSRLVAPPSDFSGTFKVGDVQSILDWSVVRNFTPGCSEVPLSKALCCRKYVLYDRLYYGRCYIPEKTKSRLAPGSPAYKRNIGFTRSIYMSKFDSSGPVILPDQPLISATALPYIYQYFKTTVPRNNRVYLLPQFCSVIPIPVGIMMNCALQIPAILCVLEVKLRSVAVVEKFLPEERKDVRADLDLSLVEASITAPTCFLPWSYERLEFMGDSVLKLIQTTHLFFEYATHSEGGLSLSRNKIENNSVLAHVGKKLGIFDFLYAYNLSRKSFQPPATDRIVSVSVSSNMVADAFEAVIGSFDINGGFDLAFQVVRKAFMSVAKMESTDKDVIADIKRYLVLKKFDKYIEEIAVIYNEKCPDIACEFINTRDIEKSINYVFKNKSILVEALTHPSSSNTFVKRSYERLEFLGDALLGYIIARKIFLKYGTYPPGPMSLLKGNLVNNRFLSLISYNLGIHKHMDHTASSIFSTVGKMAEQIQEIDIDSFGIKSTPKGTPDHNPDLPWCNMEYSKSLSDVYESIVGAVYIDSGLNLKEAESFIDRTLYNPWIWRFDNAQIVTENMEKTPTEKFSEYKRTCLDIDEVERILDDNSVCFKVVCHDILVAEATATRKRVAREHCIMKALEYFEDNPTFCTCH